MQYNAAVCFGLTAIGLLLASTGRSRSAAFLGAAVGAGGLLALLKYGFGTNLGFDTSPWAPGITLRNIGPGTLEPLTALCFALSGLYLLCPARVWWRNFRSLIRVVSGSLILAFSAITLIGHVTGLAGSYAWGEVDRMTVGAAVGFLILSVAMLAGVWSEDDRQELAARRWLPIPVGVACLTATVMLSSAMLSNERHGAQTAAAAVADLVAGQIRLNMNAWQRAFTRMAQRLESAEQPRQREWESDAYNYVRDNAAVVALERLDSASIVRWVVPHEGNEDIVGKTPDTDPSNRRALQEAQDARETTVSAALQLAQGGTGFWMLSPIRRDDPGRGLLIVVFRLAGLLKSVLVEGIAKGYRVEVLEGSTLLYGSPRASQSDGRPAAQTTVALPGTVWTVRVRPQFDGPLAHWSPFIAAVVLGGLIVSLLLSLSLAFAQAAWLRARESELVKGRLQKEIIERERSEEAMRENEERFRLAFGDAPIGMALVTPEGRWLRVNHSLCRMLGFSEAELLATDFQTLTHPGDLDVDLDLVRQVLAGDIESYNLNKRYFHKSGRVVNASLHVSFVREKRGRPGYFVSQIQDITQRLEMDRVKSEFISTVSHELRTPLTSIAGSLGLLAGGVAGKLPVKAARLVGIAERNSGRLVRLINDILDIEKAAAGMLEFDLEQQPLEPIVRQAIEANQEYAARLGVRIELLRGAEDVTVRVDRDRLTQVLTNLISNAAKFSPEGARVSLGIRKNGRSVQVSVQDRGPGIAEAFRSRIFHQFAQADSSDSRSKGGTGLGLSIARAFMERLNGGIDYETVQGEGTTFFITLPLCATSD